MYYVVRRPSVVTGRDLVVRGGCIVTLAPGEAVTEEIDIGGCIVMAGGIDMHTHIGGGKVNLARLLMPELQRAGPNPIALPSNPLSMAWSSRRSCSRPSRS